MAGHYFQFPLCLLAYGQDKNERIDAIVSHNVVSFAIREGNAVTRKFLKKSQDALDVSCPDPMAHEHRWSNAQAFVRDRERAYGNDALVRIGAELVWDCKKGALSFREFSLLCALNSVIGGSRKPKRVTEPSLRVRAAGYKSWKVFEAAVPARQRKAKLLTVNQVRYSLERLHSRRLLARARVGAKTVKYMTGVSDEDLRRLLIQTETFSVRFKQDRAGGDAAMRAAIQAIREKPINVVSPINVGKVAEPENSTNTPDPSRNGGDMSNDMVPDMGNDINVSISNESTLTGSLLNESSSNESKSNDVFVPSDLEGEKEESGYVIEGRFLTIDEANRLAVSNPSTLEALAKTAKRAVRRGDAVIELTERQT